MAWRLAAVRGYNPTERAHKKSWHPPFYWWITIDRLQLLCSFNRLCQSQIRFELIVPVLFFFPGFLFLTFCAHTMDRFPAQDPVQVLFATLRHQKHRLLSCLMLHTFWFDLISLLSWDGGCVPVPCEMCRSPFSHTAKRAAVGCSVTPIVDPSPGTLESLSSHCDFLHRNVWWLTWPPPPNYFSSLFD